MACLVSATCFAQPPAQRVGSPPQFLCSPRPFFLLPATYFAQPPAPRVGSPPPPFLCPPRPSTILSSAAPPFNPRRVMVRWQPPPPGWFKLNFDGSFYNDGSKRASIGGAIRDCNGQIVAAFAETTEHSSVGIVEARALIRGLQLALSCYIGKLEVEGDDLVLVQLLREEDTQTRIPMAIQQEIITLLRRFSAHTVQHIYREGNQVAHVLCREAYLRPGEWKGGVMPQAAWEKAQDDKNRVGHERVCKIKT